MTYDQLKLENQLCFPLYACAKEVVKQYTPLLDALGITYTQYIVMLALWQYGDTNVKTLGERVFLDSGTLTPLLKKLAVQGLLARTRSSQDERNVLVHLTPAGEQMKERAREIPQQMRTCIPLDEQESMTLYHLLYKVLGQLRD